MARIDIFMPVRNGMPYVEAAIRSIIAQTERDWRLVVLDHASTDATPNIVDAFAREDLRIERVRMDANLTVSEVRNHGLAMSEAELVVLHDADDLSVPHRIASQRAYMEANAKLAISSGGYIIVDPDDRVTGRRRLPSDPQRLAVAALFSNPIAHPAVMIRMSVFRHHEARYGEGFLPVAGEAPPKVPTLAEDYLLFGQFAILGLCGNVPEPLIRYRRHAASVSIGNFDQQMAVSAEVSRYLMRVVAERHGVAWHDPAPFCNHGARLYDDGDPAGLPARWAALHASLVQAFGDAAPVRRELAFRVALRDRRAPVMLPRMGLFLATHRADSDEMATIRHVISSRFGHR